MNIYKRYLQSGREEEAHSGMPHNKSEEKDHLMANDITDGDARTEPRQDKDGDAKAENEEKQRKPVPGQNAEEERGDPTDTDTDQTLEVELPRH